MYSGDQDIVVANLLNPKTKELVNTHIISKVWNIVYEVNDRNTLPDYLLKIIEKEIGRD